MLRKFSILFVLCMMLALSSAALATSYYVDSVGGLDTNNGTSTSTPWRTLARATTQAYNPGDQILLMRGRVWQEPAFFPTRSGAVGNPIVLADYGTGALPKIIGDAGAICDSAVILRNVSYWTVRNLDLTMVDPQPAIPPTSDKDHGDEWMKPVFEIRGLNGGTTAHIRVENCVVHGATGVPGETDLGFDGIYIMGGYYQDDSGNTGYVDDVVLDGVEAYGNYKAGIEASCRYYKTLIYDTTHVTAINCISHDNGGDGIVMGPVANSLIDNCVAYGNGWEYNARVGLWFWDSRWCTTQNSESYAQVVPPEFVGQSSARDGSGFDLDLGMMDSVMQYCYSHDNMGEGYLLMEWPIGYGFSRGYTDRITLRYSISENDATDHGGVITFFGGVANTYVYNNTIWFVPERNADTPVVDGPGGCVTTSKWGKSGSPVVTFRNNIFICDKSASQNPNAVAYLIHHAAGTLNMDYNDYWTVGTTPLFFVMGKTGNWTWYRGKGYEAHGWNVNPMITGAFGSGEAAYHLAAGSPMINAGVAVTDWSGSMGTRDYYGTAIPNGAYDVGCDEY